jgi:hypothetical protein
VLGYLNWIGTRYRTFFYVKLWTRLAALQENEPPLTKKELNQWVRDFIGLTETNRTRSSVTKKLSPFEWLHGGPNAQASLVEDLMRMAVEEPKIFCRMFAAAFLTPPKHWRRRATTNRG